jgi:hypothetical protein
MAIETFGDGELGTIQTLGKTTRLSVNGTDDIAIGDYISSFTSNGIGGLARDGDTVFAIALEAYSTDDGNGIIDALFIPKRVFMSNSPTLTGITITATSTFSDAMSITNANATNALTIDQNGNVGLTESLHGALFVENTGNTDIGFNIYSNIGATAAGQLANITADNTAFDQTVLNIDNDGTGTGVIIDQNGDATGLSIDSEATTNTKYALDVNTAGGARTAQFIQGGDDRGVSINKTGTGAGNVLHLVNAGTGYTIYIDDNEGGGGPSINIDRDGNNAGAIEGIIINVTNAGAGGAIGLHVDTGSVLFDEALTLVTLDGGFLKTDSAGVVSTSTINLTTDITGTLPVGNGGTGAATLTDGGILLGSGTGAITAMSVLADGSLIVGDGATDPIELVVGADGKVLMASSTATGGVSWETVTAAATAGGNDTEIQVNEGGSILAYSTLTYSSSTDLLTVGSSTISSSTITSLWATAATTTNLSATNLFDVSSIDATTETTLEAAIDALSNLVTVGTLTGGATGAGFTVNLDASTLTCTGCIDISANTNLTAGRSLTLTGDDVAADAELYTDSFSIALINTTTTRNGAVQWKAPTAVTITQVDCSTNGATVTIGLDERALTTPDSAGTDIITGGSIACDSNNQSTASFDNAGIAAEATVSLDIDSVANATTSLRIHIEYTKDD